MAQLIETTPIDGLKVYGQQMVDYTVQGEAHKAYDLAMARAAFAQTTAIEIETEAYGEVLKMRQKKLEELGDCVAQLSRIITAMDADESDDFWPEGAYDPSLRTLKAKLEKYGVTLNITDETVIALPVCYVEYGDAETAKANAEYAMDNEDNDLQQDMVTLQGLISKRDEAFNNASKITKKYNNTARSIINMIGQ
ncbi:MAG: hypothetical protein IKS20_02115 [Victivallales bacterium]|nr:hypothetical protein [Victivallales bacterium]